MHKLEIALLEAFRKEPTKNLSTTQLVETVLENASDEVKNLLTSPDKQQRKSGKVEKARLHRKLLYHVNKLVEDELLQVTGVQGRGEKIFTLAMQSGDIEIVSGNKRIHIHKPAQVVTPIDDAKGVVIYDPAQWTRKVNAVLLEAQEFERLSALGEHIVRVAEHVNDVIGVEHFESVLGTVVAEFELFLQRIMHLQMRVNLRVVVSTADDIKKVMRFCRLFAAKKPEKIQLIFCTTPKVLQDLQQQFTETFTQLITAGIKINIQNMTLTNVPILVGKIGTYTLPLAFWEEYLQTEKGLVKGVILCGSTITLEASQLQPLHKAAKRSAQALFIVERVRRVEQEGLLRLQELGCSSTVFVNYLRLWNFSLEEFEQFKAANEVVGEFCEQQERIYRACGMPIRFSVQLGSSLGKQEGLLQRTYTKTAIKGLHTLQEDAVAKYLTKREQTSAFFTGDRVRFFHAKTPEPEMIFRESAHIMNTYHLPFITFDCSRLQGDVKLTEFMGKRS